MDTETREHLEYVVSEFQNDIYLSGIVRIPQNAIVLDVGAHIGLFTKQAIRAGAWRVVSFEPVPENVKAFCWNLSSDIAASRVSVVTKGAWNTTATLGFMVDPKYPGRSSCVVPPPARDSYRISIEVAPLDLIVSDLKIRPVDFIKMDIEGAELKALRGAEGILRHDKPQLAIAVEHTSDPLQNACLVRELVFDINPEYRCVPGPYRLTKQGLAPDVLYFN